MNDPVVGALGHIDPAKIVAAAKLVRRGQVVSLNRPLDEPKLTVFGRPALTRRMRQHNELIALSDNRYGVLNDDVVEFALQGSSHWDSLAHFGVIEPGRPGVFYGDRGLEETSPAPRAQQLGIDAYARTGIVTRGVLIDAVNGLSADNELAYLADDTRLTANDIDRCLASERLTLERGDGVLVYTGFTARLDAAGSGCSDLEAASAGLDSSTMPLWKEREIAFLASDNLAVEAIPIDFGIHAGALRECGLPLGELWALDELAAACRREKRFEFLFMSAPLNIPGAFGSPANALAIL